MIETAHLSSRKRPPWKTGCRNKADVELFHLGQRLLHLLHVWVVLDIFGRVFELCEQLLPIGLDFLLKSHFFFGLGGRAFLFVVLLLLVIGQCRIFLDLQLLHPFDPFSNLLIFVAFTATLACRFQLGLPRDNIIFQLVELFLLIWAQPSRLHLLLGLGGIGFLIIFLGVLLLFLLRRRRRRRRRSLGF